MGREQGSGVTKRGWATLERPPARPGIFRRRGSDKRRRWSRPVVWACLGGAVAVIAVSVFFATRATAPRVTSSWEPPSLADVEARLHANSFADFVASSSRLYLLRFPQAVAELGLADELGVRNDRLNDYSEAYARETAAIEGYFLDRLKSFDRSALDPEEQAAYDVCQWSWTRSAARRSLDFRGYAVDPTANSPESRLLNLFAMDLPLQSADDLKDYIACLSQVERQLQQISQRISEEAEKGIVAPDGVLSAKLAFLSGLGVTHTSTRDQLGLFTRINGTYHPFYVRFREAVSQLVPRERQSQTLKEALDEVEKGVIPGFEGLHRQVAALLAETPEDAVGIGPRFGAEADYARLLRDTSGTTLNPEDVHRSAQADVERLRPEIARAAAATGIRPRTSIATMLVYVEEPEETPDGELIEPEVLAPRNGFDMRRAAPRVFPYAEVGNESNATPWSLSAPDPFYGFLAGCELYLARLVWEEEATLASPRRALAALLKEYEAAVAAVVDTGIHFLGWGLRAGSTYYQDTIFQDPGPIPVDARYAVSRLAAAPALAAGRYAALATILDLRATAQARDASFSLERFHNELLAYGARPLETIVRKAG